MTKKVPGLFLMIPLVAALLVAACGSANPTPTPTLEPSRAAPTINAIQSQPTAVLVQATATKAAALAPAATTAPQPAAPTATTAPQAVATATEEALSLASRDQGLDKLKSYRIRWRADWASTDSGKTDQGTWDWVEEYTATPPALHWTWILTGTATENSGRMELWQIDNTTYMVTPDDSGQSQCQSFSGDEQTALSQNRFSLSMLGGLSGATYAGTDTVNGVRAKHYTYGDKSVAIAGFSKASGDTWVAVDGGYVVKDTFSWEGSAGAFGGTGTGSGRGTWTWDLSNANQPLTIKAPENCGGATADLPIMPNATSKQMMGPLLTYSTVSKPADVAAFYLAEMPKVGWAVDGDPTTVEGLTTIDFKKDAKSATVTIITQGNSVNVMITLSE